MFNLIPKEQAFFDLFEKATGNAHACARELAEFLVYRPRPPRRRTFRVLRTDRGYLVAGRDLAAIDEAELEEALRAAGVRPGDAVTIGDETLEWV